MSWEAFVDRGIHRHYWERDDTCALTTLAIASRLFDTTLESQLLEASLGMWGAGGWGAQCGLVEGALMFIGVFGSRRGLNRDRISALCRSFAQGFERRFGSLICRELRPQGFSTDNPPHLCEELTGKAIRFTVRFVADAFRIEPSPPEAAY